ncbi:MAG: MnmC family methyltransferase [Phormidesmis sp.]
MLVPVITKDGSSTFYSEAFGEWFHNREGAFREAQQTYIETVGLKQRVRQKIATDTPLKILDICYGLGYNTAAALETAWAIDQACLVEIKALEIDIEVARSAIAQNLTSHYSLPVQQVLQRLATHSYAEQNGVCAEILLGDARQQIQPLISQNWQADIIFLDPFSPPNCPQLWTTEFLNLVAQSLSSDGVLATYSCAAAVRASLDFVGLAIGSTRAVARKWPGTVACHATSKLAAALLPLSQQEQEHLQTRAAIPYRDPTLQSTAKEILERRIQAQSISPLMLTNPWRRRWNLRKRRSL